MNTVMTPRRTLATAGRVLRQFSHDPRSVALLLLAPSLFIGLFAWLFSGSEGVFDRIGGPILAIFPFILMFLITSVTTLRERRSGTLERLMTSPLGKGDFILGYALVFGLVAVIQGVVTVGFSVIVCDLHVEGPLWLLVCVGVIDGMLGTVLGLLASAFARTEFQAVQFMPLIVFPQLILSGVFMPRDQMPSVLTAISDWLPLTYAVEAVNAVTAGDAGWDAWRPILIVCIVLIVVLVLAAASLRRRTP